MKVFSTSLLALIAAAMVLAPVAYAQDVEKDNFFEVTAVGFSTSLNFPP